VQRGSVAEVCYVAVCYRVTLPEEVGFRDIIILRYCFHVLFMH
jgi:hypothetical protein